VRVGVTYKSVSLRVCVGGFVIEELYPMGFFPSKAANQIITSYWGRVVLSARVGSRSANISTTTSAAAEIAARLFFLVRLAGAMVQEAPMFKAERLES